MDEQPPDDLHAADPVTDALGVGVEQFQRAALDAVRAVRAVLDAAETVLREPETVKAVVDTMGAMARTATELLTQSVGAAATGSGAHADDAAHPGRDDEPGDGFERISVD